MQEWCLEVWGEYACFTRPEMKVERVSYDVITPSAARGIFEAILWKPAIRWHITKIEVINPIKWVSVRRNEVGKKISKPTTKQMYGELGDKMGFYIEDERQLRAGLFLRDVRYRIYGYFEFIAPEKRNKNYPVMEAYWADSEEKQEVLRMDELPAKYAAMFARRASKGQCYHRPYLGCREFACDFKLIKESDKSIQPIRETKDFGFMLYDLDFAKNPSCPAPLFYRAQMLDGVINSDRREVEVRG